MHKHSTILYVKSVRICSYASRKKQQQCVNISLRVSYTAKHSNNTNNTENKDT